MDKVKLIDKYKKGEKPTRAHWRLKDGSIVIGEEVDEQNRLQYVIKRGNEIKIEYAGKHRPVANLISPKGETVIVPFKQKLTILDKK